MLQNAINKYGADNFSIYVIDHASNKDELDRKEQLWINKLKSTDPNIGYNVAPGDEGGNVYKFIPDDRMKYIKSKLSSTKMGAKNPHHTGLNCLDMVTGSVYKYSTVKECADAMGVSSSLISGRLNGRTKCALRNRYIIYKLNDIPDTSYVYGGKGSKKSIQAEIYIDNEWKRYKSLNDLSKHYKLNIHNDIFKKFKKNEVTIKGYRIRKVIKGVSTNPDECKGVGSETSADSKR